MDVLEQAIVFAVEVHKGMVRKGERSPYILHPMEVASIASTMTKDKEIMAAAALHDVVEDAGVLLDVLKERFGDRVAELVESESEDKRNDRPPEDTWQLRKQESLNVLKESKDMGVKILWLSDKLANMRSFYRNYLKNGNALWKDFNQKDPRKQEWYYRSVSEAVSELKEFPAWEEFNYLIDKVFEDNQ
ncbi:HD domain-containing protein [Sporofaciens sp. SGI.106]|uniref:HD domain-containing protein n=1 Tax=Sporofaciens sp. SGI.106 TaxID=3420568 RepID=UPI002A9AAE78|nr:HD domain-containing protein [Lachnoclostridium sp.]